MLVCPQCQFENPDTNKFCQECGVSLTQKTCPACDSVVSLDAEYCPNCGTTTGTYWLAVVIEQASVAGDSPQGGNSIPPYLDQDQRYRILETLQPVSQSGESLYRVLDCHPFQLSPLEITLSAPLTPDGPNLPGLTLDAASVPAIARPYLELQSRYYHLLPGIHDTWQYDGQQVLLLEERSHLPLLMTIGQQSTILPVPQILHWFYEITELWTALAPWHCCQTVLELDNLRVDEDWALCLQRLHTNPQHALSLSALGSTWQILLDSFPQSLPDDLYQLVQDLQFDKIFTIEELQLRIEAIATQTQVESVATIMIPDPQTSPPDMAIPGVSPDPLTGEITGGLPQPGVDPSIVAEAPTRLEQPLPDEEESDDMPTVVLPMQLFSLEDAGRTDIGRQRDHNEDYFGIETQVTRLENPMGKTVKARGLYILCDGMGGHAGGEVASALAVDTLRRYFQKYWSELGEGAEGRKADRSLPPAEVIRDAIQHTNRVIYDVNQQNARSGSGRMGTTLVMVVLQDTEFAIAHVGDSRLYRYTRKRGLEQLTVDHEVGQREIQRGVEPEIAYARPDAYQLTQALGPRDEHFVNPDVQFFELNEDTLLLLASDGLTDNELLETCWQSHIDPLISSKTNLDKGVGQLIDLANQHNGHDNITAIAVRAKVRPNLDQLR